MTNEFRQSRALLPPFRPTPESTNRIMATQLVALMLPGAFSVWLFGVQSLTVTAIAIISALTAETVCNAVRHETQPGSILHSAVMGTLLAFTLPADCPLHLPAFGAAATVIIGKQLFGGLGHYLWHPALIGRIATELFFHQQLSLSYTSLGARFNVNVPLDYLRNFSSMKFEDSVAQIGQYLQGNLPPLENCIIGNCPGGLGETCGLVLIITGLYLVYRGYLHWKAPFIFIVSAYLTAALCPVKVGETAIQAPIITQGLDAGITYVNYQIFSGGLILAAFILMMDMTSRPITLNGQLIFAAAAGTLAIIFRLYTPVPLPSYAAILVMNTLIPTIDRLSRPVRKAGDWQIGDTKY